MTIRNSGTHRPHPRRKAPRNTEPVPGILAKGQGPGQHNQRKPGIRVTRHEHCTGQDGQRNGQDRDKQARQNGKPRKYKRKNCSKAKGKGQRPKLPCPEKPPCRPGKTAHRMIKTDRLGAVAPQRHAKRQSRPQGQHQCRNAEDKAKHKEPVRGSAWAEYRKNGYRPRDQCVMAGTAEQPRRE